MIFSSRKNLNDNQSMWYAFSDIKGLSLATTSYVCTKRGIQKNFKLGYLGSQLKSSLEVDLMKLPIPTENFYVDHIRKSILTIKQSGSYKGQRLSQALPVRGQRTKSNARTQKKKRPLSAQSLRTAFHKKKPRGSQNLSKSSRNNSKDFVKVLKNRSTSRKI